MSALQALLSKRLGTGSPALLIGVLALGWALVYLNRSLVYPLLPVIGDEFHLSGTQRGAIVSTYFALYVAMQVPSGVLGDRLGLKRVLIAMYLIAGLGLLAIGLLAWNYALLLVFMGVHAFGAGAYYSGSYGLTVSAVPSEKRGASAAVVTVGMGAGLAAGLLLANVLYRLLDSWRLPYLVLAVPTLLLGLVFVKAVHSTPALGHQKGGFGFLLRSRDLLPLCLAAFCLFYVHWVLLAWAPSFLYQERGVSLAQSGPFAALITVPAMAGAFLFGRLSDRFGRKRIMASVVPFVVLAIVGLALVQSTIVALACLALYGLSGAFAINPLAVSWAGDHILASRRVGIGTGIAVFNAFAVGSSIIGPLLSGWVLDVTGSLEGGFLVAAGFATAGFLLVLLPRETIRAAKAAA